MSFLVRVRVTLRLLLSLVLPISGPGGPHGNNNNNNVNNKNNSSSINKYNTSSNNSSEHNSNTVLSAPPRLARRMWVL